MKLTPREIEYLVLACKGGSLKQHATQWNVSIKTIQKHREAITKKLEVHGAGCSMTICLHLLQYAFKNGLIKVEEWLETTII